MSRPLTDAIERGLEAAAEHEAKSTNGYAMSLRTKAAVASSEVERLIRQRIGDLGFELLFPTPKDDDD